MDFQPIQPCRDSYLRVKWSATEALIRETKKVAVSPLPDEVQRHRQDDILIQVQQGPPQIVLGRVDHDTPNLSRAGEGAGGEAVLTRVDVILPLASFSRGH